MRKKPIIITIIILAIAVCGGIYSYSTYETYQNITMDGLKCEVPTSDVNTTNQSNYQIYDNTKDQLKIVVYDEVETDDTNNTTSSFDELKNTAQKDSSSESKNNVTFNKTPSGLYSYYGNYSGRNVLITTPDENIMIHILQTLKVEPLEIEVVDDTNQTDGNTTVSKNSGSSSQSHAKTSSKKSSSVKSSSSDGLWYDYEYGGYYDSNGRTAFEGQFPKGTPRKEVIRTLKEIGEESQ